MTSYSEMSDAELEEANLELSGQVDQLRAEQLLINTELNRRHTQRQLEELERQRAELEETLKE